MWLANYYTNKQSGGYIQGKLEANILPYQGITNVKDVRAILKPLRELP